MLKTFEQQSFDKIIDNLIVLYNQKDFSEVIKKTKTLIFLFCELTCDGKIITSASGVWKMLKIKPSKLGPGG